MNGNVASDRIPRLPEKICRGTAQMPFPLQFEQTVQRNPAQQARVGMGKPARTRLPDSLIGLVPMIADVQAEVSQHRRCFRVESPSGANEADGGVNHLAVHVELKLTIGGVPDSNGSRVKIAGEMGQNSFPLWRISEHIVENPQVRRV